MATNLNPGADASLVAQSYRMGMAGVPQDLSKTFQGIADSYSSAMTKVGAAAKQVSSVVGKVAAVAVKDAIRIQDSYAAGTNLTQEGVEGFKDSEYEDTTVKILNKAINIPIVSEDVEAKYIKRAIRLGVDNGKPYALKGIDYAFDKAEEKLDETIDDFLKKD